jgi:hypothetical protein
LNVKLLRIFFHVPPLLLEPPNPLVELPGLPKSHCGGVVGGVIGSPNGLCDEFDVSSWSDSSTGEMTIPSESLDDHGDIVVVVEDIFEEFDVCLVECERVRANCENADGADARLLRGADDGMDCAMPGDDRRSLRVERR